MASRSEIIAAFQAFGTAVGEETDARARSGWVDVQDHEGDGISDQTALTAAVSAALSDSKPLKLWPGTYDGRIVHTSGHLTIIADPGTTLRATSGTTGTLEVTSGADLTIIGSLEVDGAGQSGGFAAKFDGAGDLKIDRLKALNKPIRFNGANGRLEIGTLFVEDSTGHGVTWGSGSCEGGTIGEIIDLNCEHSGVNASAVSGPGVHIGRIISMWTNAARFPSNYAACRFGNGLENFTVGEVYAYRKYRGVRLTDTNGCWIRTVVARETGSAAVLLNSKDQIARNSGVGEVFAIDPCRENGLPARGEIVDEDPTDDFTNRGAAVVVAAGAGWFVGPCQVVADEYITGLGVATSATNSTTVTCYDSNQTGQDFNAFDPLTEEDWLFTSGGALIGRVLSIGTKHYWANSGETVEVFEEDYDLHSEFLAAVHHASQSLTLDANALVAIGSGGSSGAAYTFRTPNRHFFIDGTGTAAVGAGDTAVTGTGTAFTGYSAGWWIVDADENLIGEIASTPGSNTALTLVAGARRALSGAFKFVIPKKMNYGITVPAAVTGLNFNRGASVFRGYRQSEYNVVAGTIRPTPTIQVTFASLSSVSGATPGSTVFCTNLSGTGGLGGNLEWDGSKWKRVKETGMVARSDTADYTWTPLTDAPIHRLTGTITGNLTITVSTTAAYHGSRFTAKNRTGTAFNVLIKNQSGATLATVANGADGTVEYDESAGAWRN